MTSWYKELTEAFYETGDNLHKMVTTLTEEELRKEFSSDYWPYGNSFTAWGEKYVYFPVCYGNGSDGVGYAPRNPCGEATEHLGG